MLLVNKDASGALRMLREKVPTEPDDKERLTQTWLLAGELQAEGAITQIRRIMEAHVDGIDASLSKACEAPSKAELERLVVDLSSDRSKLQTVAEILRHKAVCLSDRAFRMFADLLFEDIHGPENERVWIFLGSNASFRLGKMLEKRDWTWSTEQSHTENMLGSLAIAAANRDTPLDHFVLRIAPMTLSRVVVDRGLLTEEVRLVIDIVNEVVMEQAVPMPETPLEIFHDRDAQAKTDGYLFSFGDIQKQSGSTELIHSFTRFHPEYDERRHKLAKRFFDELMDARRKGAHFYFEFVDSRLLEKVVDDYPNTLDAWLDGMTVRTDAFRRRAQSAEGLFVSLCETLLIKQPELGLELWYALKDSLTHVNYTIHKDMDRMLDALFRAKSVETVEHALETMYSLDRSHNDSTLIEIVVAARRHGRMSWLESRVLRDKESMCPLHQRRAAFLTPLLAMPTIDGGNGWPQGELGDRTYSVSWKLGQREAFAHHWLKKFAHADSEIDAYAAWQLFLACVDRRVWSWFADVLDFDNKERSELDERKSRFLSLNEEEIYCAIRENEKDWQRNFTNRRYPHALRPWSQRG